MTDTTVYYLEMHEPPSEEAHPCPEGFSVSKIVPPQPKFNQRFYRRVGGRWDWTNRLVWTDDQWHDYVHRPELHTWLAQADGTPAGYFEFEQQADGDVEIVYFGLNEEYIGRGFGRAMLAEAIRQAWELPGTRRVWVHTCTKDHPGALANYQRRGFHLYKTELE